MNNQEPNMDMQDNNEDRYASLFVTLLENYCLLISTCSTDY